MTLESGSRFGRLTVVRHHRGRRFECVCVCGRRVRVVACLLLNGHTQGCGCRRRSGGFKHGKCPIRNKAAVYNCYCWGRQSCRNARCKYFPRFGGRGIQFNFDNFIQFYKHVGDRPGPNYRLERIDKDGDFEIGNLAWIPRRRRTRVRK